MRATTVTRFSSPSADGPALAGGTSRSARPGIALPLVVLVVVVAAGAYLAHHACSSAGGCYDGARSMWRDSLPFEIRARLRMALTFVLSPWLYLSVALVLLAERRWPARKRQKSFSTSFFHDFTGWFLLDRFGLGFLFALVFGYSLVEGWWSTNMAWATLDLTPHLPEWALLLVSFVFADFLNWLHHVIRHKVPLLWIFHAVHHSDREMNVFTDDRVHPVERVVAAGIMLFPQLILRIDVSWTAWMLLFQQLYTHVYHGNIRTDYGPLRWILVTPQSHRIHHSAEPEHVDRNFGVVFSIWDRLFGTHCDDRDVYPQTGVDDPGFPHETRATPGGIVGAYLLQFAYPFFQIYRRVTTGTWFGTTPWLSAEAAPTEAALAVLEAREAVTTTAVADDLLSATGALETGTLETGTLEEHR